MCCSRVECCHSQASLDLVSVSSAWCQATLLAMRKSQGVVAGWHAPSGKLIWRAAFAREPMFVTGYDEANRADLGWQQSHSEKSGKQALKFISFSWKDGGKSSHSKPIIKYQILRAWLWGLTRNSLTVNSLSYQVFKNLFENKKNERLFTGCIIGTDRKNGSKMCWNRTQSIGNQNLALET